MRLKNIVSVTFIILTTIQGYAQKKSLNIWDPPVQKGIKALKPGDELPDFKIAKIFNDRLKSASTKDFKDKLVIFDFGNTHCSGCIAALPRMEQLEKQFGDKVKIFWVTPESKEVLQRFWNTNKYVKNNTLSTIVEDSTLRAYFPHKSWPHEAWVYKGKVVAITGPDYVDENNISKILKGEKIDWPVKDDFYVFDGAKQPLFKINPNQIDTASTFLHYTAISDYKDGVNSEGLTGGSGIIRDTKKRTIRAFFLNQPIFTSYVLNWNNVLDQDNLVKPGLTLDSNQVIWEVSDKSKYMWDPKSSYQQEFVRQHAICFESVYPDTGQSDKEVYQRMIKDLDRLLGLHVRWEKRREKVLVLVLNPKNSLVKSEKKAAGSEDQNSSTNGSLHLLRGVPPGSIVNNMNQQPENPYVFDETNYSSRVDLDLDFKSWTDIQGIRNSLIPYGLDLREEERTVDKLVFTERVPGALLVDTKMIEEFKQKIAPKKRLPDPTVLENERFLELSKKKAGVIILPSGLQYKILKSGAGARPGKNDKVMVNFTGMLANGKVFDTSYERGKPSTFLVSELVGGLTEALQLMPVGSKWKLFIPYQLAYGENGYGEVVPPKSPLEFDVELVQIVK